MKSNVWLFVLLFIFLVTLGVLVYYIRYQTSVSPKASSYNTSNYVSLSNSYIFSSPIRAKANGDLIRVTVFLLDDSGRGIYDRQVSLVGDTVKINEIQSMTDDTGKALFDISSSVTGSFTLEARSESFVLPQKIKVIFD